MYPQCAVSNILEQIPQHGTSLGGVCDAPIFMPPGHNRMAYAFVFAISILLHYRAGILNGVSDNIRWYVLKFVARLYNLRLTNDHVCVCHAICVCVCENMSSAHGIRHPRMSHVEIPRTKPYFVEVFRHQFYLG